MGSGPLACTLCREPLGDQEARCTLCGVATPDVAGVRVLLADPLAALQATRDEVLASFARSAAASATSGSDTQANAAIAADQSLYEQVTRPALAVARHGAPPSALASTFASSSEAWALTSLLKYFYADWRRTARRGPNASLQRREAVRARGRVCPRSGMRRRRVWFTSGHRIRRHLRGRCSGACATARQGALRRRNPLSVISRRRMEARDAARPCRAAGSDAVGGGERLRASPSRGMGRRGRYAVPARPRA